MSKEEMIVVGGKVFSFCIGYTIGTWAKNVIHPSCNKLEKVVTTIGACGVAWAVDRVAKKPYYEFCDQIFGTELVEELELD